MVRFMKTSDPKSYVHIRSLNAHSLRFTTFKSKEIAHITPSLQIDIEIQESDYNNPYEIDHCISLEEISWLGNYLSSPVSLRAPVYLEFLSGGQMIITHQHHTYSIKKHINVFERTNSLTECPSDLGNAFGHDGNLHFVMEIKKTGDQIIPLFQIENHKLPFLIKYTDNGIYINSTMCIHLPGKIIHGQIIDDYKISLDPLFYKFFTSSMIKQHICDSSIVHMRSDKGLILEQHMPLIENSKYKFGFYARVCIPNEIIVERT